MTLFGSKIRDNGIRFLESMKGQTDYSFRFSSANKPNLIGSSLAVMLGALLGWLETFSDKQKKGWASYLNSFQKKDGFFWDDDISKDNRMPGYTNERALMHRSRHALFALSSLGYRPKYNFLFVNDYLKQGVLEEWLRSQDLSNFWDVSNKIMDLALFLSYDAIVNSNRKAKKAIEVILDICDENTDSKTGYHDRGNSDLRNAMAGAMHIYPIYFIWKRTPTYPKQILKTTLSLQQSDGLFSYDVGTCGEDCLDYDAVYILVNFYFSYRYYHKEIKNSLMRFLNAVERCSNPDGGFCCHRRCENYTFGTKTTRMKIGASSLWSTYSRIVAIAMAAKVLKGDPVGEWNLGHNIMEIFSGMATRPLFKNLSFKNLKYDITDNQHG